MAKIFWEKWSKFWQESKRFWQEGKREIKHILIVIFISSESALFERFFYSPEIKAIYNVWLRAFNSAIHFIILYPLLYYIFLRVRK